MEWTYELMYALLMTSALGTLMTFLWYEIGKRLEKYGFLYLRYRLTQALLIFWLMPILFLMEWCSGYIKHRWNAIFIPSPTIYATAYLFCALWGIFAGSFLTILCVRIFRTHRYLRHSLPCQKKELRIMEDICREYHLSSRRIRMVRVEGANVPGVTGVFVSCIVLPAQCYTTDELRIILRHELMHIRQGDLLVKVLAGLVCALHFFNPVAWWYKNLLDKYSEAACDYRVCKKMQNPAEYYGIVLDLAEALCSERNTVILPLAENKCELRERMERVVKCYKQKKNKKTHVAAALLLICLMIGSCGTVYAETGFFETVIPAWSKATEVAVEDAPQEPEVLTEYTELYRADQQFVTGEVTANARSTGKSFNWSIPAGSSYQSPEISGKKGDVIKIDGIISPDGTKVHVGIINSNGSKTYVSGTRSISHDFTLSKTGTYRVYIENCGSHTITAIGSYTK